MNVSPSKAVLSLLVLVVVLLLGGSQRTATQIEQLFAEVMPPASSPAPTQSPVLGLSTDPSLYQVNRVIDGDTIEVTKDGQVQKVRLIGIDTPEVVDPRQPVECFGREASAKAKELLTGQNVRLSADRTQQNVDRYGRLLRYVFLENGTHVNKQMIVDGYASEYTYSTAYQYQAEFKQAEAEAQAAQRGLWAENACLSN